MRNTPYLVPMAKYGMSIACFRTKSTTLQWYHHVPIALTLLLCQSKCGNWSDFEPTEDTPYIPWTYLCSEKHVIELWTTATHGFYCCMYAYMVAMYFYFSLLCHTLLQLKETWTHKRHCIFSPHKPTKNCHNTVTSYEHQDISNHQQFDCLFRFFRLI